PTRCARIYRASWCWTASFRPTGRARTFASCDRSTWCSDWISRQLLRRVNGDSVPARGSVSRCRCGSRWRLRSRSDSSESNLGLGFAALFGDGSLQWYGDLAVQLQRDGVLADRLDRLRQNQLPPIDLEALALEEVGNIDRRHRSVQLLGLTDA